MKILTIQNNINHNYFYNNKKQPAFEAKGLYSGSFDPITNGHMDIIRRSGKIFDSLTVVVAQNPDKKAFLPVNQRVQTVKKAVADAGLKNVEVKSCEGIVASFAKLLGIDCIVRGVRNDKDFDYEMNLSNLNKFIEPDVDTIFVPAKPENAALSSTAVREVYKAGGNISNMVPKNIAAFLSKSEKERFFDSELYTVLENLGMKENNIEPVIKNIQSQYKTDKRAYDGVSHIVSMLDGLNEFMEKSPDANKILNADELKFAIFMHDFINGEQNDVTKSAVEARKILKSIKSEYNTDNVEALIKTTDYTEFGNNLNFDQKLIRDLDLKILGEKKELYKDFANSVRQEHSHLSEDEYKSARYEILAKFYKLPCIYLTEYFGQKYENAARVNILNEMGPLLR